jgi:flagellar export protein FliJ
MAFKFSLNTILKYREELEKREERALEQCRETLASLETKLAEIKEHRYRSIVERELLLERGILGDDLHHAMERQQQLEKLEDDFQKQVSNALLDYETQMKLFLAARQKREILDELKNTQRDFYTAQQNRRDQHTVDEIFMARFNRDS